MIDGRGIRAVRRGGRGRREEEWNAKGSSVSWDGLPARHFMSPLSGAEYGDEKSEEEGETGWEPVPRGGVDGQKTRLTLA